MATSLNLNSIKVFRLIKMLRPLRAISKNQGLRISIKSLTVALPEIAEILFLLLLFLYIFGIITVNYFKGYLYNCTTESLNQFSRIDISDKWTCLNAGADWKNRYLNFDNIPDAMATLYVISNSV